MRLDANSYFILQAIVKHPPTPERLIPLCNISQSSGLSDRTVRRHIKTLKVYGLIEVEKHGKLCRFQVSHNAHILLNNAGLS